MPAGGADEIDHFLTAAREDEQVVNHGMLLEDAGRRAPEENTVLHDVKMGCVFSIPANRSIGDVEQNPNYRKSFGIIIGKTGEEDPLIFGRPRATRSRSTFARKMRHWSCNLPQGRYNYKKSGPKGRLRLEDTGSRNCRISHSWSTTTTPKIHTIC